MDDYATKLMNEAININYIDETEYPLYRRDERKMYQHRSKPVELSEKDTWKTGARWPLVQVKHVCWAAWQHGWQLA